MALLSIFGLLIGAVCVVLLAILIAVELFGKWLFKKD
jgi:hypothetical protein